MSRPKCSHCGAEIDTGYTVDDTGNIRCWRCWYSCDTGDGEYLTAFAPDMLEALEFIAKYYTKAVEKMAREIDRLRKDDPLIAAELLELPLKARRAYMRLCADLLELKNREDEK